MSEPLRVLSLGGGTQSCALALMSAAGDVDRLDHVVFADTGGELPETYAYLDYLRGVLDTASIPLHVVSAGNLEQRLLDTANDDHYPTPPMRIVTPDGEHTRIQQYRCSWNHKRLVIERTIKQLCGGRGDWKRTTVEQWIGFSVDETRRMRLAEGCRCSHPSRAHGEDMHCTKCKCERFDRWMVNRWPLIELRMKRDDTIRWFAANGHPTPPRSACWFCPNNGNERWADLRRRHPDLFARAVELDAALRDGGGYNPSAATQEVHGEFFLHLSGAALSAADLRTARERERDAGVLTLFDDDELSADCEAGVCFT